MLIRRNLDENLIFTLSDDVPIKCLLSTTAVIPFWCSNLVILTSGFKAKYFGKQFIRTGVFDVYTIPILPLGNLLYRNLPIAVLDSTDTECDIIISHPMFKFCDIELHNSDSELIIDVPDDYINKSIRYKIKLGTEQFDYKVLVVPQLVLK